MRTLADFQLLVEHGKMAAHQLPENGGNLSGTQNLPARPERTPRLSPFGKHGNGILQKPPRSTQIEASVQASEMPPLMGNLRSLRAAQVPGSLNQGADMLSWGNVSSDTPSPDG